MNTFGPFSSVRIALIARYWKFFLLHYIKVLSQYRLCKAHHAHPMNLTLQWQLSHLDGRKLEDRKHKIVGFGSRYISLEWNPRKTPLPTVLLLLREHIRCQGDLFTVPLPSDGCLFLFHNSGSEPSRHNTLWSNPVGRNVSERPI
jgi:hypothetical protein